MARASRPWMIALAVALLVGTVVAFTYTETLKLERKPVVRVRVDKRLSPGCDCRRATSRIRFTLHEPDRIDVTVTNRNGDEVRTLASDLGRRKGRVRLTWDGRDDAGHFVPDGTYRVRVRLREARRTVVIPEEIEVRSPSR